MKKNFLLWRLIVPLAVLVAVLNLLVAATLVFYSTEYLQEASPAFNGVHELAWKLGGLVFLCGLLEALTLIVFGVFRAQRIAGLFSKLQSQISVRAKEKSFRRVSPSESGELAALSESIDAFLEENEKQRLDIQDLKREREAILGRMSEGLIAVHADGNVLAVNTSAASLFKVNEQEVRNRPLHEVVRSRQLNKLFELVLTSKLPQEDEITIQVDDEQKILQVRASALTDDAAGKLAVLLFFSDLSLIKKLESVRKDFVANVSHELRTPITSIKGFVETLLEGALASPEDSKRFLSIVLRHTERLNDIISDLLALARLEATGTEYGLSREEIPVKDLYESTVEFCSPQAREKEISLRLRCDSDLKLSANRLLLEQAIINLVVNGIKYNDAGGTVTLASKAENGRISLSVEDTGIGISQEHLDRIFERFYRIDRARSREEGGSGLGLAIVKHIALAHGGEISVESELGKGSVFALHLPTMPSGSQL